MSKESLPSKQPTPLFRDLLSKYMSRKRLTTGDIARKLGVSRVTVPRWLSQSEPVRRPNYESVKILVKIFNLNEEEQLHFFLAAGYFPPKFSSDPNYGLVIRNDIVDQYNDNLIDLDPENCSLPSPGVAISHPNQFFGRENILSRIRRAWYQPKIALQHVAIIGPKRSGKTSLLKYLQKITKTPSIDLRYGQPQGWNNWLPKEFQFVFIDFQLITMSSPESFCRNILRQLQLEVPRKCDLISFTTILDEQLRKPTIFLMDEVGSGLRAPSLDAIFWSNLRALGNNCAGGKLGLVVTAIETLEHLARDSGKESPFFNIFGHVIHLEPLTEREARELISSFRLSFSSADVEWLLKHSGCWPALLQLLCDAKLVAMESGSNEKDWYREGLERIQPFTYLLHVGESR
jgi:transcriptional regulator with XRE-family HTH domain